MRAGRLSVAARLAVVALAAAALGGDVAAAFAPEALETAKTLTRLHTPVVLSAAKILLLPERRTENLRLFRVEAGMWVAIPFQFDARDRDGELVVDGPDEIQLDENDELVFMAKDAGDRAEQLSWPDGCNAAVEIELADPITGERAWAYLLSFTDPPPDRIISPYVTFDRVTNAASSALYRVEYAGTRNFFTGVQVDPRAFGSGANLVRQTRMRGRPTFALLFAEVSLDFTEQSSIVEIEGVRSGPVRVVRRVRLSVDLGPMFPDLPSGTAYTYHYLSSYWTPTRVGFPWIMLELLREFQFESLVDFRAEAMPLHYWDGAHPEGMTLGGQDGATIDGTVDHDWWVHSSDAGTMLHAFVIPEKWRGWGVARGTVLRSGGAADGHARSGGAPVFAAGYSLLNMTNLREAGTYDLLLASFVLPRPYQLGDEQGPMAALRSPLQTEVRRVR